MPDLPFEPIITIPNLGVVKDDVHRVEVLGFGGHAVTFHHASEL